MDHIETDKAFDEMTNKPAFWAEVFSEYQSGDVDIKPFLQFLHHRIELEVEKAVKARDEEIEKALGWTFLCWRFGR